MDAISATAENRNIAAAKIGFFMAGTGFCFETIHMAAAVYPALQWLLLLQPSQHETIALSISAN